MACGPHQGSALIVQPGGGLPPTEVAYLCKIYAGDELTDGRANLRSEFRSLRTRAGRFRAYLAGFALQVTTVVDTNVGGAGAAMAGLELYAAIRNMRLTDTLGRPYFAAGGGGLRDARDIIFDQVMRQGTESVARPADLAGNTANETSDLTIVYRFGPRVPWRQNDVMYPLELFNEDAGGGLEWDNWATASIPGAPANTETDPFTRLELYAIIRWASVDELVHCPHALLHTRNYAGTSWSAQSRFPGATDVGCEYAAMRWELGDAGGRAVGAIDPVTVEHGGVTWLAGRNDPIYTVAAGLVDRDPYVRTLRGTLMAPGVDYWPLITSGRDTLVTEMGRLPVNVQATAVGTHADFRVITRELAVPTDEQRKAIEDCAQYSAGTAVNVPKPNNPSGTYDRSPGLLPMKVGPNG